MTQEEIKNFFDRQLAAWPECRQRYADLDAAERRTVVVDGLEYRLQFNPARMRSAAAKVVDGKVDRPCFLCEKNRPAEQLFIPLRPVRGEGGEEYQFAVNPFPILPGHFTIICSAHCRQELTRSRLDDMAWLARELEGELIFFNGACSGASAPDHFHFQSVPKQLVPLTGWSREAQERMGVQKTEGLEIDLAESDRLNLLCWNTAEGLHWLAVRRRQHRPWQYNAEGEERVLISPASLEFAGVVPLAREEDYRKMTGEKLSDILSQCRL